MTTDTNLVLHASGAETSSGAETGIDYGGADVNTRTFMLNVTAVSGTDTPTLTVEIEESDDDSTYRNYVTFPAVTATGQYFVSGRSDARYRREYHTISGTNPSFTYTLHEVTGGRYSKF